MLSTVQLFSATLAPVDSLTIYDPFENVDELRKIIKVEFSLLGNYYKSVERTCYADLEKSSITDYAIRGSALVKLGDVYFHSSLYDQALSAYLKALAQFTLANDSLEIARVKIKIGRTYYFADLVHKEDFFREALADLKHVPSMESEALQAYVNGFIERDMDRKARFYAQALQLQFKLVQLHPGNSLQKENLSVYLNANGRYQEAITLAETFDDHWLLVLYLNNYGYELVQKKQYPQALAIFQRSLKLCIEGRYKTLLRNVYENISRLYRLQGEWKKAGYYLQYMKLVTEALYLEKFSLQVSELSVKYETSQKEIENKYLKKEQSITAAHLAGQRYISVILYIAVLGLFAALCIVAYGYRRLKRFNAQLDAKNTEILQNQNALNRVYTELLNSEKNLQEAQAIAHLANWEFAIPNRELKFSGELPDILCISRTELSENGFKIILPLVDKADRAKFSSFFGIEEEGDTLSVIEIKIPLEKHIKWVRFKKLVKLNQAGEKVAITGTAQDITEVKEEEAIRLKIAEQKSYTSALISSQEDERWRLASELHEGLGQDLLLVKNRALLALEQNSSVEFSQTQLHEINTTVSSILELIRDLSFELRPLHIERLGLAEVILGIVEKYKALSQIKITHHIENIDDFLSKGGILNVFRIMQEALSNIIKYSQAKEAFISVRAEDEAVIILIKDDGVGFNYENIIKESDSFGLKSIKQRVELAGGEIVVTTKPGAGSSMIITIPKEEHE